MRHALILAAGKSERVGRNKLLYPILHKPVIRWVIDAFVASRQFSQLVLVVPPQDHLLREISSYSANITCVDGGNSRADSVTRGLRFFADKVSPHDEIWVHDGARACITPTRIATLSDMVDTVFTSNRSCNHLYANIDGCVFAEPCVDSLKRATSPHSEGKCFPNSTQGLIAEHCDRNLYWRAQTPQIATLQTLLESYQKSVILGISPTDESSALGIAGYQVALLATPFSNPKITFESDLLLTEYLLTNLSHKNP